MSKRKNAPTDLGHHQDHKDNEAEKSFLKDTGLSSLDELNPQEHDKSESQAKPIVMRPAPSAAPTSQRAVTTDDFSAKTRLDIKSPISILYGFIGSNITYPPRNKLSYYYPSCHMMDYVVHHINRQLVDNFYFKRASPNYHPYILRLYFGVLFWIQCLRAGNEVSALPEGQHQFLTRFLSSHSLETLAIPGPLLPLFKTLCASQPEFSNYGKVYPRIPTRPGPNNRSDFMRNQVESHFLPNVPGIFALLEHLNGLINGENARFPKKGKHIPVTFEATAAIIFGHHSFPIHAERTPQQKWSLVSPGLQYPCEADQKLNESFAERYQDFDFPITAADDSLKTIQRFLGMKTSMAWFTQVKEVAAVAATFFNESGTLADCSPNGLASNQVICHLQPPEHPPTLPHHSADIRSSYPFSYQLKTTARNLPPLAATAAASSQTHIRMFESHPNFGLFGDKTEAYGPFWSIRPIESSHIDESSYLSIGPATRQMIRQKGPA